MKRPETDKEAEQYVGRQVMFTLRDNGYTLFEPPGRPQRKTGIVRGYFIGCKVEVVKPHWWTPQRIKQTPVVKLAIQYEGSEDFVEREFNEVIFLTDPTIEAD